MTFAQGRSGNPSGRAKGSRNSTTVQRERLRAALDRKGAALVKKMISLALAGDTTMLVALADRMMPKLKPAARPRAFPIDVSASAEANARELLRAVASGDLGTDDAEAALAVMQATTATERMAKLEEAIRELYRGQGREPPAALEGRPRERLQ